MSIHSLITPSSSSSILQEPVYRKLSTVEVSDQLKQNICSLLIGQTHASGFFLNKKTVVSTFHTAAQGLFYSQFERGAVNNDALNIVFQGQPCKSHFIGHPTEPQDPTAYVKKAFAFDVINFVVEEEVNPITFEILPDDFVLKEGMKVYFAGFPLSQEVPTIHKGRISSITFDQETGKSYSFTIDGTVVPGNSGGPVIIQDKGKLWLAGIIVAEVADLDPDFQPRSTMQELLMQLGDQLGRVDRYEMTDGTTFQTSRDELLIKAIADLQRNFSTGIGKAIDARVLHRLFDTHYTVSEEIELPFNALPTGKKRTAVQATQGATSSGQLKYYEREGHGKGPRMICVQIGQQSRDYKIPNPHYSSYNKQHGNFYLAVAEAIEAHFIANHNVFPDEIPFEFDGISFELTTR